MNIDLVCQLLLNTCASTEKLATIFGLLGSPNLGLHSLSYSLVCFETIELWRRLFMIAF
ncbi:MAG: hypothetical protein ACI9O0_000004 [Paracoccaceae bacterium]|jgi:hypothetical protein